jgi:hypothetical protein
MTMITLFLFSNSVVEDGSRLSKLRNELRTDHLNSEEGFSLSKFVKNIMTGFTH